MSDQSDIDVLGYKPIGGGGITNQKLAFIGLLLEAYQSKRPIALPYFLVMDQIERIHRKFDFGDVFELGQIQEFCSRYDILVTQADIEQLPIGYDAYFWKTYDVLQNTSGDPENRDREFILHVLRALIPCVRKAFLTRTLRNSVAEIDPHFIVAQFRIEKDWEEHCKNNLDLSTPAGEINYLEYSDILGKIKCTFPEVKTVFALCDEKAMPISKLKMKEVAKSNFGINIILKSDFISEFEAKIYTELHLSLIDFELATFSDRFIGITRSTFSCLATLEKFARNDVDVRNHYVYNLRGSKLIERTDNGLFWDAAKAVEQKGDVEGSVF